MAFFTSTKSWKRSFSFLHARAILAAFSEHPTIVLKKVLILEVKASRKENRGLLSLLYFIRLLLFFWQLCTATTQTLKQKLKNSWFSMKRFGKKNRNVTEPFRFFFTFLSDYIFKSFQLFTEIIHSQQNLFGSNIKTFMLINRILNQE